MQEKSPDFKETAEEIVELYLEGFFGESVKELTLSRDLPHLDRNLYKTKIHQVFG